MFVENKGIYYGADMDGGGGSGGTLVECDDLPNGKDYMLCEVNGEGAVVVDGERGYHRLHIRDLGEGGVQVCRGVNDNPVMRPGETLDVEVGVHTVKIRGTAKRGVLLNGEQPTKGTRENEEVRYPR